MGSVCGWKLFFTSAFVRAKVRATAHAQFASRYFLKIVKRIILG